MYLSPVFLTLMHGLSMYPLHAVVPYSHDLPFERQLFYLEEARAHQQDAAVHDIAQQQLVVSSSLVIHQNFAQGRVSNRRP